MQHPLRKLLQRIRFIFLIAIVTAVVTGAVSLLFPLEYRADAEVLVIPKTRFGVDPYTVAKSAERVAEGIAGVIPTNDFYRQVITNSNYAVDAQAFKRETEIEQRRAWEKTIIPTVIFGSGIVRVSAYSVSREQAGVLAGAVVDTIVAKGNEYTGADVVMKVVNPPVITNWPVRPNIPTNIALGFLLGAVVSGIWVVRRT